MKTIRITKEGAEEVADRSIDVLTKKELLALGYKETNDTMKKDYPASAPFGREVGTVIFHKVPEAPDTYVADNKLLTLFYYKRPWDAAEFLGRVSNAVSEYRDDMKKLGFPDDPETEEGEAE